MLTIAGGLSPYKREGRHTVDSVQRLPICQLAGDGPEHSASTARVQFLCARYGLSGHRATLIAPLAFGGPHG
jgi:hypothetical protein